MNKPLFAHRPPSTGVHLLNDPDPELITQSFVERALKSKVRIAPGIGEVRRRTSGK